MANFKNSTMHEPLPSVTTSFMQQRTLTHLKEKGIAIRLASSLTGLDSIALLRANILLLGKLQSSRTGDQLCTPLMVSVLWIHI